MRDLRSASTKFTPRELVFGMGSENAVTSTNMDAIWLRVDTEIVKLHQARNRARDFILKAQTTQRNNANKDRNPLEQLKIGDQVLVYQNMVEASWSRKLEPRWEGPYYIQDIKGTSCWLRKLSGTIIPNSVHRNRLKRYHTRDT